MKSNKLIRPNQINNDQEKIKVLAFTASMGRPIFLRYCCMQMQNQTYSVDHVIYNNAPNEDPDLNYLDLLTDFPMKPTSTLIAKFGKSEHQHHNHINALNLINVDDYDLFFKIDDDDLYRSNYIESRVESYLTHHWDFSGSYSYNWIENNKYIDTKTVISLGLGDEDKKLKVEHFMPPTMAFSRKAIKKIMSMNVNNSLWEDTQWRRLIWEDNDLKKIIIKDSKNFTYNRHPNGVSNPKK